MSARRNSKAERPEFMVSKYRQPIDTRRNQSKTIQRQKGSKPVTSVVPEIKIDGVSSKVEPASGKQKEKISLAVDEEIIIHEPPPTPLSISPVLKSQPAIQLYLNACKQFRLTPIKSVKEGLKKTQLACKYMTFQRKDLEAIAVALMGNGYVEEIDFQNNNLGEAGAEILSETVLHTDYISHVRISENNIGTEGAKLLCRAMSFNWSISSLDLSGNNFTEKDAIYFKALLEVSKTLKELYLSHNNFMEKGAVQIGQGLEKNNSLLVLDLSWNHIRLQGADAIGNALKHNQRLEKLNLAWNGLYMQGARALARALMVNNTIKDIDVQCNRMSEECLAEILKGLKNNTTLEILRLGQNHLTSTGAFTVLQHFKDIKDSGIKILDFGNQPVHDKFETMLAEILQERDVQVIYGTVWRADRKLLSADDVIEDSDFLLNSNPLTVIMECMRLQDYKLIDMFKSLDTNKNSKISVDELVSGLLKLNVPLRRDVLIQFLKKLDANGDGELSYREMYEAQKLHKQQVRRQKQESKDLKQTVIGRVSGHIQKTMGQRYIKATTSLEEFCSRNSSPSPSLKLLSVDPNSRTVSPTSSLKIPSRDLSPRALSRALSPVVKSRDGSPCFLSCDSSLFDTSLSSTGSSPRLMS